MTKPEKSIAPLLNPAQVKELSDISDALYRKQLELKAIGDSPMPDEAEAGTKQFTQYQIIHTEMLKLQNQLNQKRQELAGL